MRRLIAIAPVLAGLALAACSTATGPNRYQTEERALSEDCVARGGILRPSGQQSGRPQLDYVCDIRNPVTRVPVGN